jgi:hypothetical protein
LHKEGGGHCGFFIWVNEDMCEYCRRVMWRLREKEDAPDSEAKLCASKFDAEVAQHKNTVDVELAKISL